MKSVDYYVEKHISWVAGLAIAFVCYKYLRIEEMTRSNIVFDKTVDFSGILFGFLITVLTILVQTNNRATSILHRTGRFEQLISKNKNIIWASAILCLYSLANIIIKDYDFYTENSALQELVMAVYIFIIVYLITSTFIFLRIFFTIISSKNT